MYKVLITSSGTGSRLKHLTLRSNKAILKIGNKAIIDLIINQYDPKLELIVTVGYQGEEVKSYIETRFPNRKIIFVSVDKFEGEGSSLGYSMLQAKRYLQCPFIFHCNDTIVYEKIPSPVSNNWDGISSGPDHNLYNSKFYSSVLIKDGVIHDMQNKGALYYDALHIGLVGIKDYTVFWKILEEMYIDTPNNSSLNDCKVISMMIRQNIQFHPINFTSWHDTGNLKTYKSTSRMLGKRIF